MYSMWLITIFMVKQPIGPPYLQLWQKKCIIMVILLVYGDPPRRRRHMKAQEKLIERN